LLKRIGALKPAERGRPTPHDWRSRRPFRWRRTYDDGCEARELDDNEARFLEQVCELLGYDVEEVGA
jgi:hypothetical protein